MSQALVAHATSTINAGSKSFAAAARLFDEYTRQSAVMLYAWCRHCDDVVDGQQLGHGQADGDRSNAEARLAELETLTRRACAGEPVADPAFAAFQQVVQRHGIEIRYPLEHLAGFRMDVEERRYATIADTLDYCYHVAGVVGVMMARVMGVSDPATLDRACDLGLAFQLTNIARDVLDDAAIGRIYLPGDWLSAADVPPAAIAEPRHRAAVHALACRLIELAEPYYDSAAAGIGALPLRCGWAIATARGVYRQIGRKLRARGPVAWDHRIATTRLDKLGHAGAGLALALRSRRRAAAPRPPQLWTRPR